MIDPVCNLHGMKWSEHKHGRCIYCALCFVPLEDDECWVDKDGQKWDQCIECAENEEKIRVYREGL